MAYDNVSAAVALAGSSLSAVTTFCILVCFAIWHRSHRSFRHALVFNLALADFINSTTNTVSGSIYIRDHELRPGAACTFNGWIGQLSVQATDFSILAIGLATLVVVIQKKRMTPASTLSKTLICLSVWVMPLITSTVATAMGAMQPVSGNWCWISKNRIDLRYGLTHGWRFLIMLITIVIYSYIWWRLSHDRRMLSSDSISRKNTRKKWYQRKEAGYQQHENLEDNLAVPLCSSNTFRSDNNMAKLNPNVHNEHRQSHLSLGSNASSQHITGNLDRQEMNSAGSTYSKTSMGKSDHPQTINQIHGQGSRVTERIVASGSQATEQRAKKFERDLRHMLLLNGYPIMYILLWLPGITNRIVETTGSTAVSARTLGILQAPGQFVGFANAITYSVNLIWRERLRRD
ncbi:glucose receptor git3 protein [Rutstroemia sp. NJR-2017a WRK4]|nr:glucose receptor git3 protein [Rutstroemia sp. NJR-2017a WRK4]